MQVSPVDLQAWAEATGNPYPATAADKAAVLPAVIAWKQGQQAAARENRGQNSLAAPLAIAAGAGLGLAGLAAFRAFRRDGLSEPAAAQKAAKVEREVRDVAAQAASTAVVEPPPASYRAEGGPEQEIRIRNARYSGPRLRGDDESGPTAAVVTEFGSETARERGEYKARTKSGYHDPALANLDTPEKREAYLAGIAEAKGADSKEFRQAQAQIQAMEVTTGPGVDPLSFIAGMSDEDRYGTSTPEEMAARGESMTQSRTKSTSSSRFDFTPQDQSEQWAALRRSPQAEANRQVDALVDAVSAVGPGDSDAQVGKYGNFTLNADDRQEGLQFNVRRVNPFVAQQLDALKQRPRDFQVARTQLVRAPQAYLPVVPPAESTDAFRALAQEYEAQGGSLSGEALAAIRNRREVVREQQEKTTYTDLQGNPVSIAAILDKNNPISRAVQENGQWVAPLRAVPVRNKKGEVLFQELPTRGEGNLPAPKPSRARAPIGIDPKLAQVFYTDSDDILKPYIGGSPIRGVGEELSNFTRDENGNYIRNPRLYTGRKSDGSVIALSDLSFAPTADRGFYEMTDGSHPYLSDDEVAENESALKVARFAGEEDQATKGMYESVPSLGSRMMQPLDPRKDEGLPSRVVDGSRWASQGVPEDGRTDSWVLGRVGQPFNEGMPWEHPMGEKVVLDMSGYQSEMKSGAAVAGGRLRVALIDRAEQTGRPMSTATVLRLATGLAKEHNTDPADVLRMASGERTVYRPSVISRPQPRVGSLGGRARDALDRVYSSLGMYAGADSWELEGFIRKGKIQQAANALASTIPGLTKLNDKSMGGLSQDEKVNVVAEGLTAALQDLSTTLQKNPQMAEKFGIGKKEGGHGVDAFVKSYVRDWVTVRSMQMNPSGRPTYQVPNDAFEVLAYRAAGKGRNVIHEINDVVSGSPNGLVGALKIDQMVSGAQSTKEGDPNTIATNLAKQVFLSPDTDLLARELIDEAGGDVRLSFGSRRRHDPTAGFTGRRGPSEQQIDERVSEYGPGVFNFPDDSRPVLEVRYGVNNILKNQFKGADYQSDQGKKIQSDALTTQQWISENSDDLERQRADLNRGIFLGPDGPVSVGRGLVITSGERGAFVDADLDGMDTSFREEVVNDDDVTPVDLRQDIRREARILGQLDSDEQATELGLVPIGGRSEADRTAAEYAGQKLNFKNLGAGSLGAMAAGEASAPIEALKRELLLSAETNAYRQRVQPVSSWQQPSIAAPTTQWRGATVPLLPSGASSTKRQPRAEEDFINLNPGQADYSVEPAGAEQRRATTDLDRRTLYSSTWGGAEVKPAGWRPSFDDPMIQLGVSGAPRTEVPQVGSTDAAARARQFLEARAINTQGVDRLGQSFRDDQNLRDAVATAEGGYVDTVRRANAAMGQQALLMAGDGGVRPGELQAPARPERLQLDQGLKQGEVSGLGRRGALMWSAGLGGQQKAIAAEPRSEAYGPAANTLAAARVPAVPAFTEEEAAVARAGYLADYMDRLVEGGIRSSADGKRLIFKNQGQLTKAGYSPTPSEATVAGRVAGLRKRGII